MADRLFEGEEAVLHVLERIVAPLGLRVDGLSPWVDARLPDRSGARDRAASFALRSRPERAEVLRRYAALGWAGTGSSIMVFLVLPTFLPLTVVPLPGRLGTQCAHSGWKYGL